MKKYILLCLGMISLLWGCQPGENKYPVKSLQVLGWTQNDRQIVLQYENLKHDIGMASPQPTDYRESIYLYDVEKQSLKKSFTFPERLSREKGRGALSYHAPTHHIYFQDFDLTTETAYINALNLDDQSINHRSGAYTYVQNINNILISPDEHYAYFVNMKDKVYDFREQSFKTWDAGSKIRLDFYWFIKDEGLQFLTEYGIYRLSPNIGHIEQTHTIDLPEGNKFSLVGLKDEKTLYYLDRSDSGNDTFVEYDLNQKTVIRSNLSIDSFRAPRPEQLSHNKKQLAYIGNDNLTILNFSDQIQRVALTLNDFPDGGLQTAPWMPYDGLRW